MNRYNFIETNVSALHKVSKEVDVNDLQLLKEFEHTLLNFYNKMDGKVQGLALIQFGIDYASVLLRYKCRKSPKVIHNPKVLKSFGSKESNEGCASEFDKRYIVTRPRLMLVSYYSTNGKKHIRLLFYKKARIFKHEYDHTVGILLRDIGRRTK